MTTDARDPESLIEAAQKAASDGDYQEAERLLREAATIQEHTLGSHPDLATTMNNLAFVCERMNKFDEAERGYRRAHAIAVASLSPGHPLIKTSLANLLDFCSTRGIPIWTPPAAQSDAESDAHADDAPVVAPEPAAVRSKLMPRAIAIAGLVVAAIVVVLIARQGTTESPAPSPGPSPAPSSAPSPAPSSAPSPGPEPPPAVAPKPRPEISKAPVTVLNARLCSALDRKGSPDWQCTAASGDLQQGRYLFYTRLLTNADTTVEHRWLRGNRVHQVVRLRVTPSPGNGYRTFSGTTISAERAGDWKVELRAADGTVLHEERFVVR